MKVDDRFSGAKFKCPKCGEPTRVSRLHKRRRGASSIIMGAKRALPVEDEEEAPVDFERKKIAEDELDMTPMVDVVFLLLIFFMVTAAFSLQKSLHIPTPEEDETAAATQTMEQLESDNIIIRIDGDDTVWVNDSEAPSEQEILVKLREAKEGIPGSSSKGLNSLMVFADGNCRNETVVMCLDAGNAVNMEKVRLALVDEDDF